MKDNLGTDVVIHVVGTKMDLVVQEPGKRMVGFERVIAFVAENLFPEKINSDQVVGSGRSGSDSGFKSLDGTSKRSSGFWGQDLGW